MTEQPKSRSDVEALRLADELKKGAGLDTQWDAAIELRRLHQSEQEGWRYADELEQERKRLYALNQSLAESNVELLEALKAMRDEFRSYDLPYGSKAYGKAITAISKASGFAA